MYTPTVVDQIEKVLQQVDYCLMFCRNQNLDQPNMNNYISEAEENMIRILDFGFLEESLPELDLANSINRGQILGEFRKAYPELENIDKFSIYKSEKFSNFVISVTTDDISEYNQQFIPISNKYQGQSKIFKNKQFIERFLKKCLPPDTKEKYLPSVYRTMIRTGRIEHRICPNQVFSHFEKYFNSVWTKVRKTFSTVLGLKVVNLNFYSSNKDLTSLRIIRQL